MNLVAIPAHFDGKQIRLDNRVNIEPGAKLIITVLPIVKNIELKNDDWTQVAMAGLESAYGDNEPEYSLDLIIEPNSDYDRMFIHSTKFINKY
jgi:hypothetical protein